MDESDLRSLIRDVVKSLLRDHVIEEGLFKSLDAADAATSEDMKSIVHGVTKTSQSAVQMISSAAKQTASSLQNSIANIKDSKHKSAVFNAEKRMQATVKGIANLALKEATVTMTSVGMEPSAAQIFAIGILVKELGFTVDQASTTDVTTPAVKPKLPVPSSKSSAPPKMR